MGVVRAFTFTFTFFWVPLFIFSSIISSLMADDGPLTPIPRNTQFSPPRPLLLQTPPPLPVLSGSAKPAPFKPTVAVIVGVLTTMFSITFLLLLYAKHCKGGRNGNSSSNSNRPNLAVARKNSGIDRSVVESLPIFRFSSLGGQKEGLECAVCLNRFEATEVLRLLPKCKHAFHVECVDTWLDAHSTCPLCRYRVDPEDILLIDESKLVGGGEEQEGNNNPSPPAGTGLDGGEEEMEIGIQRISGRHSSAGEGASHLFVVQRPGESDSDTRRSLDTCLRKKSKKKDHVTVGVGCFERGGGCRKDGLLLLPSDKDDSTATMREEEDEDELRMRRKRFEHSIVLLSSETSNATTQRRWSDLRPSDLLYLRSKMILSSTNGGTSSSNRGGCSSIRINCHSSSCSSGRVREVSWKMSEENAKKKKEEEEEEEESNGTSVISGRSLSEITGLNRFSTNNINNNTMETVLVVGSC